MFSDNMTILQALNISGICIVIVFAILIFISLVLNCFKFIFKEKNTKSKDTLNKDVINENESSNSKFIDTKNLEDEEDVIAVISAVIKASKSKENSQIYVKSLERIK